MEVGLSLLAAVVVLGPWVLAVIALVRASRAARLAAEARAAANEARLSARRAEQLAGRGAEAAAASSVAASVRPPQPAAAVTAAAPPAASTGVDETPGPLPAVPASRPGLAASAAAAIAPSGAAALEEKIALVWFARAGALAVLVGAAYFLKYAIDNAWIGPWGRIGTACVCGAAAIVAGEVLRPRTRAAWIHALQGAGIALLFLGAFASHAFYRVVPVGVAFAAVAAVALAGGALAVRHRAELLLALALVGGFLAPVVLSTGEDRPLALFGYLFVLGGLALAVSARLGFRIVPWMALAGTVLIGGGWFDRFFSVRPPPLHSDPSYPLAEQMGRYHPLAPRAVPMAAALAFGAAWLAAWERFRRAAARAWADGWLAASLLFAEGAPFLLVHDRPLLGGLALAAAGLLAAMLLRRAGRFPFVLAAEVLAFALLSGAAEGRWSSAPPGPWIAAAALVAATYLAVVAHAWLVRAEAPSVPLAAVAAVAGLAFSGFAIALTGEKDGVLRALLVGSAGAAELALGAALVRRARLHASVLLGASLALLAGAAAFLFSGASVTVVWAAMACTAAFLGARERDKWWLAGAGALLVAVLVRVAAVDLGSVAAASQRFLWTDGAEGRLEPIFLLNPRALALAAAAAALLASASAVRRAGGRWRIAAGVAAGVGWAVAVVLAVTEARDLVLVLPSPPPAGDAAAFGEFLSMVADARTLQSGALSVTTSVVMAACAALLVGGGFAFRDAFHRRLGLGLFGVVVAKLLLADVWHLARLQQVAVFLAVGVLLLAAAFLYARYGRRIAALLRDEPSGPPGGAVLLALIAVGGLAAPARALDVSPYRIAAGLDGVAGPGLYAVEAGADVLRASRAPAGTLADVRIEGPNGAEVPWTLRGGGPAAPERTVEGSVIDPVVLPDGTVRALVDLGADTPRHGELRLDLAGDEFLRPVRIEVSSDGRRFGVLAEGARVWAIRETPDARRTWIRHPASQSRFVRVTLLPGAGDPPRVLGARAAAGEVAEPALSFLPAFAPSPRRSPDGRETLVDVDLGAPGVPVEAVDLAVATRAFERRVRVLGSADGAHWVAGGDGVVWRTLPGSGAEASEGLRVWGGNGGRRWLRIAVADGDSPPLEVTKVRAGWRPREILFQAAAAGPHVVLAGADVPAPSYDLAGLLARAGETPAAPVRLGAARPNPRFVEAGRAEPFTERHRRPLAVALAALFAGMALWAVRLLRRAG
jgi:hypothetical protein